MRAKKKKEEPLNPQNFSALIDTIAYSKGIGRKDVISSLEQAITTAARDRCGYNKEIEVLFNEETCEVEIFQFLIVADEVLNPDKEIIFPEARELDPECEIGDEIGVKINNKELGRIGSSIVKNSLTTRVNFESAQKIYDSFKGRIGETIEGTLKRFEANRVIVDVGQVEASLPKSEQSPRDFYKIGEKIKALIIDVNNRTNTHQVILSRKRGEFVVNLMREEVLQVRSGEIEIKAVSREAGIKTKIAVYSHSPKIDPIAYCIGPKGSKINPVSREIRNERIDVVLWSKDEGIFLCNALTPATASKVIIDDVNNAIEAVIPDDQLSLAIGKNGINIKLVSRLLKKRIDVLAESKEKERREKAFEVFGKIDYLNDINIQNLYNYGIRNFNDVEQVDIDFLYGIPGLGSEKVEKLKKEDFSG